MLRGDSYTFLIRVGRADAASEVGAVLDAARVPHRSGLLAGRRPAMIFTVPRERLDEARAVLVDHFGERRLDVSPEAQRFPLRPVVGVGSLIAVQLLLVIGGLIEPSFARRLIQSAALVRGATLAEPWRLVTYLVLHADPLHVFWNGVGTMVFAVPLLIELGYARAALIYLCSGIGGGLTALHFAKSGASFIGSSGAVAGLFGAWVVLALSRTRLAPLTRRARILTVGIALLVLPSLLTPVTTTGRPVSVASHLGGLATGTTIGALLSLLIELRARRDPDADLF